MAAAAPPRVERTRNICILAHVDHGKTTLADSLISSNGIISERLAGSLRYLDDTPEEQERGITIKSSAISLVFRPRVRPPLPATAAATESGAAVATPQPPIFINLIDCPGHVDFSPDVAMALRICDGALVVVDVTEGVCVQTHAVLRQAWAERVRPCLVLNKMDRLIVELGMTPVEANRHLAQILEQVNEIQSSFLTADAMAADGGRAAAEEEEEEEEEEAAAARDEGSDREEEAAGASPSAGDHELHFDADVEARSRFSPAAGNVIFASALDGWAFRVDQWASMLTRRGAGLPGVTPRQLRRTLWGEYAYSAKTQKVTKIQSTSAKAKPLFVRLVLRMVWRVYKAAEADCAEASGAADEGVAPAWRRVAKIASELALDDLNRAELGVTAKSAARALMRQWLPLAPCTLSMVKRCLPSPVEAQKVGRCRSKRVALSPLLCLAPMSRGSPLSSSTCRTGCHCFVSCLRCPARVEGSHRDYVAASA